MTSPTNIPSNIRSSTWVNAPFAKKNSGLKTLKFSPIFEKLSISNNSGFTGIQRSGEKKPGLTAILPRVTEKNQKRVEFTCVYLSVGNIHKSVVM